MESIIFRHENIPEPAFDCECCGPCFPEHYTISLVIDNQEFVIFEYDHDGHLGGHTIIYRDEKDFVSGMLTALAEHVDIYCAEVISEYPIRQFYGEVLQARVMMAILQELGYHCAWEDKGSD